MLTLLAKLLKVLNSDSLPIQIALAISLAMLVGFNSILSLMGVVVILLLCLLRVNLSVFLSLSLVFTGMAVLVSPISEQFGYFLLSLPDAVETWTSLYQYHWFRIFQLNNTLVLGSFVLSAILFVPLTIIAQILVVKYRQSLMTFVNKFKIVQSLKASKFFRIYDAVNNS